MFTDLPVAFGKANEVVSDQPGRAVVSDFLNKVLKLAALRIADICERLTFEPVDKNSITVQVPLLSLSGRSKHSTALGACHLQPLSHGW